jgi:hypothetical protein
MFPNELEFLVRREHYQDLLGETERARLVRQARAGQESCVLSVSKGRNHLYRRALTWLGGRLVVWGWHLQERYGAATAVPALRAANRTR